MSERTPTEAPSAPAAAAPDPIAECIGLVAGELMDEDRAIEAMEAYRALAARCEELEQTTAELCEDCGWRMRFPGEECANCERYRLRVRYEEAVEALREADNLLSTFRDHIEIGDAELLAHTGAEIDAYLLRRLRRHEESRTP